MSVYKRVSLVFVLPMLLVLLITPTAISQTPISTPDFSAQYKLQNQKLFVTVQPSLYNYYSNLSHTLFKDTDYAKLITPQAVESIALNILKTNQNFPYSDEQFANAVLSMVHQIPYNITGAKYPVETLVDNQGDCGSLSILAASIMQAGGLDVVLIKYTGIDPPHMNVGVHLPHTPMYHSLLMIPTSFEYNNKTYWAAEATPQGDWKVGDQSYSMANAIVTVISLDDSPKTSPGQIGSNLGAPPLLSNITINVTEQPTNLTDKKRALLISGSVQPVNQNGNISIFICRDRSFSNYNSVVADDMGAYNLLWNLTKDGTYYVTASSSGNGTYAGMDSETLIVFIGPPSLLQFQADAYNYIIGVPVSDVAIRPFMGINDFLDVPLGTNLSLSYNFRVLQTGTSESEFNPVNVTVPAEEYTITARNRPTRVVEVPSKTRIVPTNIPIGMTSLTLPRDFNQTINSNFCLIIQKDPNSSYSLSVKGLNDNAVSNIKQDNQTKIFLNATEGIEQSTWYKVTTTISDNEINAKLQGENGTHIENLSTPSNSQDSKQLVLLLTNNVDSAIVLKDFKIQPAEATVPLPQTTNPPPDQLTGPVALIWILVAVALSSGAAMIYAKKRLKRNNLKS